MPSFLIEGGRPLHGSIRPIGNKNAALPMLAACLLTDEPVTLHNLPQIGDVRTLLQILGGMGVAITQHDSSVTLCARGVSTTSPDPHLFGQIRGSLTLMGPLLGRMVISPSTLRPAATISAAAASTPICRSSMHSAPSCATTASLN